MKKSIIIIFISIILFSFFNCSKYSSQDCLYYNPPSSLIFKFVKNRVPVKDSVLKKFKISFVDNGIKTYISDLAFGAGAYVDSGLLATRLIGTISADKNIKSFIVEYSTSEYDTLLVNYLPRSPSTNCFYVLQDLKFKNKTPIKDTSIKLDAPIYVLDRP